MKTSITLSTIAALCLLLSCGEKEVSTTTTSNTAVSNNQVSALPTAQFQGTAAEIQSKIGDLQIVQDTKAKQIESLSQQRDSIQTQLQQVSNTLQQVSDKKINPGIQGVHTKLDELKGQQENLEEQAALQEQELALAEKKITLLNEEKTVYDAQHKALYDKGAMPAAFEEVDARLGGIQDNITTQGNKVKSLKQSISTIAEQKRIINSQRSSLSAKIRDNYTAQQILDEYTKEEQSRLEGQLAEIDAALNPLLQDESQLQTALAVQHSKKEQLDRQINTSKTLEENEKASLAREQRIQAEEKAARKSDRIQLALVSIGGIALLLLVLFVLGKRRKKRKQEYVA